MFKSYQQSLDPVTKVLYCKRNSITLPELSRVKFGVIPNWKKKNSLRSLTFKNITYFGAIRIVWKSKASRLQHKLTSWNFGLAEHWRIGSRPIIVSAISVSTNVAGNLGDKSISIFLTCTFSLLLQINGITLYIIHTNFIYIETLGSSLSCFQCVKSVQKSGVNVYCLWTCGSWNMRVGVKHVNLYSPFC